MNFNDVLGFDSSFEPTILDSLFRDVRDPTQWSVQVPSFFVFLKEGRPLDRFFEADELGVFPLAFLFSRELAPDGTHFRGPSLVDKSVLAIQEAWSSPDFPRKELEGFRSSLRNMRILAAFIEKFDCIGDLYLSLSEQLCGDIQSNFATYTEKTRDKKTVRKVQPARPIYVSPFAMRELDSIQSMVDSTLASLQVAKQSILSMSQTSVFLLKYEAKFQRSKEKLASIRLKTEEVDADPQFAHRVNNHSENVFALADCLRIMFLFLMLSASLECAFHTTDLQVLDDSIEKETKQDEESQSLYEQIMQTESRLQLLNPMQQRFSVRKRLDETRQIATRFEKSLIHIIQQLNFQTILNKFKSTTHEVLEATAAAEEDTNYPLQVESWHASVIPDLIQQGKDLQYLLLQSQCSEEDLKTPTAVLQVMADFNNRDSDLFKAFYRKPDKFQAIVALFRQRMDVLYRDFSRTLLCSILKECKLFSIELLPIDHLYFTIIHATNLDKHVQEYLQSAEGKQAIDEKRTTVVAPRSIPRIDSFVKVAEVKALRSLSQTCALQGLCSFALFRRSCPNAEHLQAMREKVGMVMVRTYFETLVPLMAEFVKFKDVRELSFFDSVCSFSNLANQNTLNMNKTFLYALG